MKSKNPKLEFRHLSLLPIILLSLMISLLSSYFTALKGEKATKSEKPRIIITADPELDDSNSLIRLLLYSTDFNIEGLIYASSQFHWKGDGKGTKWFVPGREYTRFGLNIGPMESWRWAEGERFIHAAVDAYEKVYPNLKIHHPDYPSPAYLRSVIRYGNVEFDGDISKDTEGSELIKSLILDQKPGKLYITAWGGQSTIARALKSIQETYDKTPEWPKIKEKISEKVVLLPSGDQDDTYANYIQPNWPDIESRQFAGGPNYSYGAQLGAKPENAPYLTSEWMKHNITDQGPLGAIYRVWGDGKQMVEGDKFDYFGFSEYTDEQLRKMGYIVWMPVQTKGSWLGEGDTFTYMDMLNNGLRAYENGTYAGWGGRTTGRKNLSILSDTSSLTSFMAQQEKIKAASQGFPDFFEPAQKDFAARMKWSVTPDYQAANHEPRVWIQGPLNINVRPGEKIRIKAGAKDPDRNYLTIVWEQYIVGSYQGQVLIEDGNTLKPRLLIPENALPGQTIHIVLSVKDDGSPALTRYQRVILTVLK